MYIIEWLEDDIDRLFREEIGVESVAIRRAKQLANRNQVISVQLFEKKLILTEKDLLAK